MTLEQFLGLYNYWIVILLMMTGFYIVIARENLVKTIIGLNIFQTSVILLYVTMGKVHNGVAPIIKAKPGAGHDSHGGKGHAEPGHLDPSHVEAHGAEEHASQITERIIGQVSFDQDVSANANGAAETTEQAVNAAGSVAGEVAEKVAGHVAEYDGVVYSNPLPSVLMLTAIVVGIATTALALALIVRIREDYGTIEEDEILEMDRNS